MVELPRWLGVSRDSLGVGFGLGWGVGSRALGAPAVTEWGPFQVPGSGSVRKMGAGGQVWVGVHVPTMHAMCMFPLRVHVPITCAMCTSLPLIHVPSMCTATFEYGTPEAAPFPLCHRGRALPSPVARCCPVGKTLLAGLEQPCPLGDPTARGSCSFLWELWRWQGLGFWGSLPTSPCQVPAGAQPPAHPVLPRVAWVGADPCFRCPCPPRFPPKPSLPMYMAVFLGVGGCVPLAHPAFGAMG